MFGSGLGALVRGVWSGAGGFCWLDFYEDLAGIPYLEAPKLLRPPRKLSVSGICGGRFWLVSYGFSLGKFAFGALVFSIFLDFLGSLAGIL